MYVFQNFYFKYVKKIKDVSKYDDENLIKIVGVNNGEIVGWRMIF